MLARRTVLVLVCLLLAGSPSVGAPSAGAAGPSAWWPEVADLDAALGAGKWKRVAKQAPRLAREVTARSWFHPDLRRIFGELALDEALAAANLNRDAHAVWMWHTAQNIDPSLRDRDLRPYGRAAKLLYEHPLRAPGEVPFRWRGAPQGPLRGTSLVLPKEKPGVDPPVIMYSAAVKTERSVTRPVRVELIYDRQGVPHQPIAVFPPDVHPALLWAVLRSIPDRVVDPARLNGETIPFLTTVEYVLRVIRGSSREPDFSRARLRPRRQQQASMPRRW